MAYRELPASAATIGTAVIGATAGSVLFVGAGGLLSEDNTNFNWDDTNNRLLVTGVLSVVSGAAGTVPASIKGAAAQTANMLEMQNSSGTNYLFVGPPTLAGDATTKNFLNLTATMPTTLTAAGYAINAQVTSAGSSSQTNILQVLSYLAGYTGSSLTSGQEVSNAAAGTGANVFLGGGPVGNFGTRSMATATTTGHNVGVKGTAFGGNVSYGVMAEATTNKNSATNIGVAGFGLNGGSSPVQVGGYFGLQLSAPTYASAALMADNGATTSNIFVARDNGSAVFTIADGAGVTSSGTFTVSSTNNVFQGASASTAVLNVKSTDNSISLPVFQVTDSGGGKVFEVWTRSRTRLNLLGVTSGSAAATIMYDSPDAANAGYAAFGIDTTTNTFGFIGVNLGSAKNGSGTLQPFNFLIGTNPAATIDTSSNFLLARVTNTYASIGGGATASQLRFLEPSASGSNYTAFVAQAQSGNITYTLPAADAAGFLTSNGSGALTWTLATSGTYTPTLTNVANLDASTAYQCQYMRVGVTVTVSGKVDIDPTLAATSTQLGISLPVASNFGALEDCAGVAFAPGIAAQGSAILADTTNDRAVMQVISGDVTNQAMYFTFTYEII